MTTRPSTPARTRIYAVGDIHGRLDLLTRLLAMIESNASGHPDKQKKLIFLGDYIDRGLESRGVIERLCKAFACELQPVFLRGNHDAMLMDFMKERIEVAPLWFQHGGVATLASYGLHAHTLQNPERTRGLSKELHEKIPAHHKAFFENTLFSVNYGDYFFVHAGVNPTKPLDRQKPEDLMWVRGVFTASTMNFGKFIVHGHSITKDTDVRANRLGIDTGAYATGVLTCVILDGTNRSFLKT